MCVLVDCNLLVNIGWSVTLVSHTIIHFCPFVSLQMTGMSVAPVEDEECEFTTMQQVAAARYQRNHRLMVEIFNDVVIPVMKPSMCLYPSSA